MRRLIVGVVVTGALCALSASAQQLSAQNSGSDDKTSTPQNWVFGTSPCVFQYHIADPIINAIGVNAAGDIAWFQTYEADETCDCITAISTQVWDINALPGEVTVYVWSDPTGDRDPGDAVLIAQSAPILVENTDFLTIDLITPVTVASGEDDRFWVGAKIFSEGTEPDPPALPAWAAPFDGSVPSNDRAWVAFNANGFNAENLPANPLYGELASFNLDGVWGVVAVSGDPALCGCTPADMNCDGVVDALDIEPFICLLFDPNCPPCSPCAGDVNEDGTVNAEDIEPFINILFP